MSLLTYEVYYHRDAAEGSTQPEVNSREKSNRLQLDFNYSLDISNEIIAEPQNPLNTNESHTLLMSDYSCRMRRGTVPLVVSSTFLGPTVLHLLPRLPAGPGAGQVQGAFPPPRQPAHPESRRPPEAGDRPRWQPRPPGPHHHVQ